MYPKYVVIYDSLYDTRHVRVINTVKNNVIIEVYSEDDIEELLDSSVYPFIHKHTEETGAVFMDETVPGNFDPAVFATYHGKPINTACGWLRV